MREVKRVNSEIFRITSSDDGWQQRVDAALDLALQPINRQQVFGSKPARASALASAYPLYNAIAADDEIWEYVRTHTKLESRKRLPNKKTRALFATMVALSPRDKGEKDLCRKIAPALEELAHQGVADAAFAKAYLATTDDACRKAIRFRKNGASPMMRKIRRVRTVHIPTSSQPEKLVHEFGLVEADETVTLNFKVQAGARAILSVVARYEAAGEDEKAATIKVARGSPIRRLGERIIRR